MYATGNLSYSDPMLNLYKLSFIQKVILDDHFPIQIDGKQIYKNNVCTSDFAKAITHQSFLKFHLKNRDFLYSRDNHDNLTFHSSLIHHTLNPIKLLKADKIAEYTGSTSFILYAVLIVIAIILGLLVCFCPAIFVCIFSAIFTHLIKFLAAISRFFYKCIRFIYKAVVDAYLALKK